MKRRNVFTLSVVAAVLLSFTVSAAWAGPKQRHRWQGVAIGVGAAIIGSALWKAYQEPRPAYPPRAAVVPGYDPPPYKNRWERGHWEVRKEWVPPSYRRVWNPGHYDRRGRWIPGTWIAIEDRPGCWRETRVWVARR